MRASDASGQTGGAGGEEYRGQVERIEGLGLTARMRTGSGDVLFTP